MVEEIVLNIVNQMEAKKMIEEGSREFYEYALVIMAERVISVSTMLIIAIIFKQFLPTVAFLMFFLSLRKRTGGYHADKFWQCYLLTVISYIGVVQVATILSDKSHILFAKGSKTAIIGRNGSGKTTIINLITRMYEPASGKILLGADNISELSLPEYRNMVSVVSQQIYLFNDTIRNNICLYKQMGDDMIEAACKDSGLEEFIKEVSLDYVVGQNGAMLSGGQKQKIALARALVYDKPIVIFDEATSNTDAYSEQQINGLLDTKLKEKTVIVITHKKEILGKMDQLVVLKDGIVVDIGAYDELIGKNDELNIMMKKTD